MKLLFVTDGARENASLAQHFVRLLPTNVRTEVHVAAFTWPVHRSALWDATWDRFLIAPDLHDLHHAAYETATEHLTQIEQALSSSHIQSSTRVECGAPVDVIPRIVRNEAFDFVVLARGLPECKELVDKLAVPTLYVGSDRHTGAKPEEALKHVTAA